MEPETAPFQGIQRTAAVLRALAKESGSGARLTDLAAATGLSKSTLHRILNGLTQVGLVEHDEDVNRFLLGFDLFVIGTAAANRFGIVDISRDSMTRLAERTGDTIFLSLKSGVEALCVDRCEGSYPIKVLTLHVGDRRPLGVGAGSLALLAFLSDAEVEKIIASNAPRLSAYPNFGASYLYELVEITRRRGYSFNDGRIITEMQAVGVPVMGRNGRPAAAISAAAITPRMQPDRRMCIVEWLKAEARSLEKRIAQLTEGLSDQDAERLSLSPHELKHSLGG